MPLKFKGDKDPVGKKKKEKKSRKRAKSDDEEEDEVAELVPGTGRIVATGDLVNGFTTSFQQELEIGDELRVLHPGTLQHEQRPVSKILGNRSCLLVSAFSKNFATTTGFEIEKRGRLLRKKIEKEEGDDGEFDAALDKAMQEKVEKALKKQKKTIQIREKVYGGGGVSYRTIAKEMDRDMTAEDALNERVKLGRDKHCY
ncbi:unnamed protein product [Amoebophrya sp. A25]|nr:unnamed protein product [Amoebophrya sp. A25]|eukprot:GSA25T00002334001.1